MKQNKEKEILCRDCGSVKCYGIMRQIYYCDNEDRTDDMGKLGVDKLSDERPDWCPLRSGNTVHTVTE